MRPSLRRIGAFSSRLARRSPSRVAHSVTWLIASALFAGAGQGLGQLGGLTLIADNVQSERRAEANAVFNMGGYIPAGSIPVLTGYLIDYFGLDTGITFLAGIIGCLGCLALTQLHKHHAAKAMPLS
ncbi:MULTISPECIES: MFS transporter [unclassified Pseudomonas]|uniref:MFS transporter n=1 Tax=unclassified Pseudomonas TaxID=196821 RepID=UPI0030D9C275